MSIKKHGAEREVEEKFSALLTNVNAIRNVASAVEGTLGPKGLDTMLVDRFGDVVVTNAGVTILDCIDASHPAARMLINIARAQHEEIGDGTTTATIMSGTLVSEALNYILRGVPVSRIIEGMKRAIAFAEEEMKSQSVPLKGSRDKAVASVALVAGRGHKDIADLITEASVILGEKRLLDPDFRFSDAIITKEGVSSKVINGVIISKNRLNKEMPKILENVKVLVFDDSLEPERIEEEALTTESGFARYREIRAEFIENIKKVISSGVKLILVDRGVDEEAEEIFAESGVMVFSRLSSRELRRAAEHTGARALKRSALRKTGEDFESFLGFASLVENIEKLEMTLITGGNGRPVATFLVGAATEEVAAERERIAKDAASAVQAALRGGVVAGGGASEIAAARKMQKLKDELKGMESYGVLCVIEALRKPLAQMVQNAGFNPLEKVEEVISAQSRENNDSLAIDCDTGEIKDLRKAGILDPAPVKLFALRAAAEVAEAVLRINTIIKMKESSNGGTGEKEG